MAALDEPLIPVLAEIVADYVVQPSFGRIFGVKTEQVELGPEFYERKLPKTDSAARPGHN